MARTRSVGVRNFVDYDKLRLAFQDRVQIHLGQLHALVTNFAQWNRFEIADQSRGFGATVSLDKTNDNIAPLSTETVRLFKHTVGLAHASSATNVDFKGALFDLR